MCEWGVCGLKSKYNIGIKKNPYDAMHTFSE